MAEKEKNQEQQQARQKSRRQAQEIPPETTDAVNPEGESADPHVANREEMEAVRAEAREKQEQDRVLADESVDELDVIRYDDDEDALIIGADEDVVIDDMAEYTDDEEIQTDFAERQRLNAGSKELLEKLREHHAETPDLTADDIDAAWEWANVGDETVGGTAPTPDQDIVDELGEAVGLTYDDNEMLDVQEKITRRDEDRWELDPASAETELDRQEDLSVDAAIETAEEQAEEAELSNETIDTFEAFEDMDEDDIDEQDDELQNPFVR